MKTTASIREFLFNRMTLLASMFSLLFWVFDSFIDSHFFYEGTLAKTILRPDPVEIYIRFTVIAILFLFAFYAQSLVMATNRSERAQRESEERFRALFRFNPAGVFLCDRDGKFLDVNLTASLLTGYTADEFLSMGGLRDLMAPDIRGEEEKRFFMAVSEMPQHFESAIRRKSGEHVDMDVALTPVVVGGAVTGVFAVMKDISDRKGAERELRRAKEQAENATKLKDKFVSLVSHDLKSPLTSMYGFLKLMRNDPARPTHRQTDDLLERTIGVTEKMNTLIDDLLNIGRLRTGKVKLGRSFIDLRLLVARACAEESYNAEKKGITLKNDVPEHTRVYADSSLFYQVAQNMLSNAVKFSHAGGEVSLFVPEGMTDALAVSDTGVGIEDDRRETVFKYDEATSTPGTAGETGTGLGLPLCREIVEAHGGRMYVESSPDAGSTFYATLPPLRPRIMIVEDDRARVKIVQSHLASIDADVVMAGDGKRAVDILSNGLPHLILLDLFMPEMDGFEFLRRLKGEPKTSRVPVIVVTAHGEAEVRERAFKSGADDFVSHPVAKDELVPRVRRLLE